MIDIKKLFQAAKDNNKDYLKIYFIEKNIDCNIKNEDGLHILGYAAHFGSLNVVQFLVECGVDVNALSQSKIDYIPSNTALHAAIAGSCNLDVIRYLLQQGASPNLKDSNGHNCLHVAAMHSNNKNLIQILIEYGGIIDSRTSEGQTALDIAKESGHDEVVDFLRLSD